MLKVEEEFPVGSRVEGVREYQGRKIAGIFGTVLDYDSNHRVLVEFDVNIKGHDGNKKSLQKKSGKQGHCYFVDIYSIKLHKVLDNPLNRKLYPNREEYKGYLVPKNRVK